MAYDLDIDATPGGGDSLSFVDLEFGDHTQASQSEFDRFTLPSQTQTQSQHGLLTDTGATQDGFLDSQDMSGATGATQDGFYDSQVTQDDFEHLTEDVKHLEFEDDDDDNDDGEGFVMSDLPPHACVYCGIHDPSSVVQCVESGRWFCNSRGNTSGRYVMFRAQQHGRSSQRAL